MSPCRYLSHGEGVSSVRSKAPMAVLMFWNVTGFLPLSGKAFWKSGRYSGMEAIFFSTVASSTLAISTGFRSGPPACSSTSAARPSQNW